MYDTTRTFQRGQDGKEFKINADKLQKRLNEKDEVVAYFNKIIDKKGNTIWVEYDIQKKQGLILNFNMPKIANNTQIENFKISDKEKLYENLYEAIDGVVDVDIDKMRVSRLDVTMNIETENKVGNYINALASSYVSSRNYKEDFFSDESFTIHNNSRRFVFYDKIKEQKEQGAENLPNKNILRLETQNSKGRDVANFFKSKDRFYFNEIFKEAVVLDALYFQRENFKRLFMSKNIETKKENEKAVIDSLYKKSNRNLVIRYITKEVLNSKGFSFQKYENDFKAYYTERGMRKVLNYLRDLQFLSVKDSRQNTDLVSEVYDKLNDLSDKLVA